MAYQTISAAAFHLLFHTSDADGSITAMLSHLKEALTSPGARQSPALKGALLLSCHSLRAILCSQHHSYQTCQSAVDHILPVLASILQQNPGERIAGDGIQFLISDGTSSPLFHLSDDHDAAWISSLHRQRAFSLCLSAILHILESRTEPAGSLVALGSLIKGVSKRNVSYKKQPFIVMRMCVFSVLEDRGSQNSPMASEFNRNSGIKQRWWWWWWW